MDYQTIQEIAMGVVETSSACDGQLFTGTVSSANPLGIKLGDDAGGIVLDGDDIILTQAVVSKKIYIKKHTHEIGSAIAGHTHKITSASMVATDKGDTVTGTVPATFDFTADTEIVNRTIDAWCTEYGHKLPVEPSSYNADGDMTVITINRGLEVGDKVIMTRVSSGQQFVVLSRYFEVDKPGEDDQ